LRRPIESTQYTSFAFQQGLDDHHVLGSIGSVGDADDTLRAARDTYRAHQDQPPEDGEVDDDESTVVLSVWQYLGSGDLNPGDCSWPPASKPPYELGVKRCWICVVRHRDQRL
jgi:hypothetical protein